MIFESLNMINAVIAKKASIDPSVLSRFRCGKRIPSKKNSQIFKVCEVIAEYAKDTNNEELLHKLCSYPKNSEDKIPLSIWLTFWFLNDNVELDTFFSNLRKDNDNEYKSFGDKLSDLMNLLGISNIKLANVINMDSSFISRLRNGERTPSGNHIIQLISSYLFKRAKQMDYLKDLHTITGMNFEEHMEIGGEILYSWLADKDNEQNIQIMRSLLDKINNFTINPSVNLPPFENIVTPEILKENTDIYYGISGLRHAVIRLLGCITASSKPVTLFLYSDQNMEWMTSDTIFFKQWSVLMSYVLRNNNRIKIIHNLNRDFKELLEAIDKWLPLYMTGLIESYYLNHVENGSFCHTMFIAPGIGAIVANFVKKQEETAEYRYITGTNVEYYLSQFDHLTSLSKPFVRMYMDSNTSLLSSLHDKISNVHCDTKMLLSSPSIGTMSPLLFNRILHRAGLDAQLKSKLITYHQAHRDIMQKFLESGTVTQYIFLPDIDEISNGRVPINISGISMDKEIFYNSLEFADHISELDGLLKTYPNYRLVKLEEKIFPNIQIILNVSGIIVMKKGESPIATSFGHPEIISAYMKYFDKISKEKIDSFVEYLEELKLLQWFKA